jgi:hypothetical protein
MRQDKGGNMKRFEKYKANGTVLGTAQTVAFGKVTCYENLTHGDEACIVVFTEAGEDISDEFDAWDVETFRFIANDL